MTAPEYIQLKAYARQDGFFLALLWITSFIFYIIGLSNSLLAMASLIMAIVSPFFVASRLRNFRDVGREGFISFGRSYAYTIFVFFYGAVLLCKEKTNNIMDISVVIPLYNEDESIPELYAWIERVMKANNFSYEVIFINDGSTDRSWEIISELNKNQPDVVKGIKFRRNYGKSPALYCGFEQAQGDVVITMDADLQDSPDEIPELYRMIKEDGYDLVSGYKQKRYDPISKTIPTKLFNATARKISGIKNLHDFNCGLKAYRKAVVKNIEVYGEMHRYIPYLAKNAGFNKIGEKVVQHQARKYGSSKFMGLNRFVNGYLDLLTLWFLSTFGKKPMHVFGFLGTVMFFIGFIAAVWIGADKLWCLANHIPQRLVTDSPFFYIALTMMILGTQLFLTGFLGDLISRSSSGRNDYQIEETI